LWFLAFVGLALAVVVLGTRGDLIQRAGVRGIIDLGVSLLTVVIAIPLMGIPCGALPAALMMGFVAAVQWRRPIEIDNSTALAS
jgi:hypothetical protein